MDTTNTNQREPEMVILQNVRQKANRQLQEVCGQLHPNIPMTKLVKVLEAVGVTPTQEDGRRWAGFICGREGRATMPLSTVANDGKVGFPVQNSVLVLSWYKHDTGRYEINAYLS